MLKRTEYRKSRILELLQTKNRPTSARDLAKELGFGFSARDVGRHLAILQADGKVRKALVTCDGYLWEATE